MMWIRMIFLPGMVGLASGLAVAGGMFALLIALGVIARFAGKTNTASWVLYYEDAAASVSYTHLDVYKRQDDESGQRTSGSAGRII